jgi:hypothetical protein
MKLCFVTEILATCTFKRPISWSEIMHLLWKPQFYFRGQNIPPPPLSEYSDSHILNPYFFKNLVSIILPLTPKFSDCPFPYI